MTPQYSKLCLLILEEESIYLEQRPQNIQGYSIVYEEGRDDEKKKRILICPSWRKGKLLLKEMIPAQHFTQPLPDSQKLPRLELSRIWV